MDAAGNGNTEDKSYEAMYESFTKRAPNKRQIKPVESQLVQFAFGGLEDSEEDDDYTLPEDFDSGESDGRSEKSSGDETEDSEDQQDKKVTLNDILTLQQQQHTVQKRDENKEVTRPNCDALFCGVCLDWETSDEDEILQCDLCRVSVHEGCYGKCKENEEEDGEGTDADSTSSTVPWFCDACKANVIKPSCELCPSVGGIYKQCNIGHWVHLICALYTPEVRFEDEEALDYVNLDDIPPSHWGAKPCSFCEDTKLCQTGITIGCDAGMCRTYFHVTCAQREGLLSDVPNAEVSLHNEADPLFAHCKLHAEKISQKKKKLSWQSFHKGMESDSRQEDGLHDRVKAALFTARKEYISTRKRSTLSKELPSFSSRLLTTCPEVCRQLIQKSELLGHSIESQFAVASQRGVRSSHPNLTTDFIKHFYDREVKLKQLNNVSMTAGKESILLLQQRERNMRQDLERLRKRLDNEKEVAEYLRSDVDRLHSYIGNLCDVQLCMPIFNTNSVSHLSTVNGKAEVADLVKEINKECFTCKSKENSHKMVECDTCHNHYHFACVDPPLKRMPRKSKAFLWQCTDCDESESDSSNVSNDDDDDDDKESNSIGRKRRHRQVSKPEKFTPDLRPVKKRKSSTGKQRKKNNSEDTPNPSTPLKIPTQKISGNAENDGNATPMPPRRKKKEAITALCTVCAIEASSVELVKCAECQRSFHFKTCLDPPSKSTPQKRGYSWHCTDCDDTPSEDTDNQDNDNVETIDDTK